MEDDVVKIEISEDQGQPNEAVSAPTYFQFWLADGTVMMRSASLDGADLPHPEGQGDTLEVRWVTLPYDLPGRAAAIRFVPEAKELIEVGGETTEPSEPSELTLIVARDTTALERRIRFLMVLLLVAGAATVPIALMVAWFIVARGLRPLASVGENISAIRHEDLDVRIGVAGLPEEFVPVVDKLNAVLVRLEAAFECERSFTGDVAHELRMPLSGLRSIMEVALRKDRNAEEYKQSLDECMNVTERLQAVIESLNLLSRLDAGQLPFSREPVKIGEVVDACWLAEAPRSRARGVSFENQIPGNLACSSDHEKLAMILSNVLNNVSEYADDHGRIWATGSTVDDGVEVTISNTGCTLTAAEA